MTTRPRTYGSRRRLRMTARLACLVMLAVPACIIIPTPESGLLEGRGAIEASDGTFLTVGEVRREDVLLRFGEPDRVVDEGRVLVYHWARAQGWLFVGAYPGGAAMPIPKHHYLVVEFDPDGLLQRYEFVGKLPESVRGPEDKRPFMYIAGPDRQVIVINPVPAWPDGAGPVRTDAAPQRLALGAFSRAEAGDSAPEYLGQVRSFGIAIADVRASRPVAEFVRAAVEAELAQAGHATVPLDDAELLLTGEVAYFGITTPMRMSLSLDVVASLDVTLRFRCAESSRVLLERRYQATERYGPAEPVTAAELQYVTNACLEALQRQLREDAEVAALLGAGSGLCR